MRRTSSDLVVNTAASSNRRRAARPRTTSMLCGRVSSDAAAVAGRSLLDRTKDEIISSNIAIPENFLLDATFTASAAETPIHRVVSAEKSETALKPCLSSACGSMRFGFSKRNQLARNINKNDEFKFERKVGFSEIRVREYEVTLGDNPSVSSGAPLSLGWRYNPQEKIASVDSSPSKHRRRSIEELKLSDEERHRRLSTNPNVSDEDLRVVLQATEAERLKRKESLDEFLVEMVKQKDCKADYLCTSLSSK